MSNLKPRRRFLTPPPGSKITLQRPQEIPSNTASAVPNPSPQKRRRLQSSIHSRPSQVRAQSLNRPELDEEGGAPFPEANEDFVRGEQGDELNQEVGWHAEEAGQFTFEDMQSSPLQSTTADTYELFAEAVMTEAIPFFQLTSELYVVTGWDARLCRRTVSERRIVPD